MLPAQKCVSSALSELLRNQPTSPGKVRLAWQVAVGGAIARATEVTLRERGVLGVRVIDPHWKREIERARPLILSRLAELLGTDVIVRLALSTRR